MLGFDGWAEVGVSASRYKDPVHHHRVADGGGEHCLRHYTCMTRRYGRKDPFTIRPDRS
jgi:hypothetical protein